ncbi:MAG TPA: magnesium-translocating P-type ATPase, partial [Ktedonobacterales bacterium]|nr:magnesium-translocating P-type ATPase [Ktedonobacterales bacterium]
MRLPVKPTVSSTPAAQHAQYERLYGLDRAKLLQALATSAAGLTTPEVQRRLTEYGPNEAAPPPRFSAPMQFLRLLADPLVIILLVASLISALLGQPLNALIISVIVLLSVILNFVQTTRSQRAAERLRAQIAPTSTVLRDGQWSELPRRALVPGDVIRLSAGDLVPADARLLETHDLHVQQAALTGESLPVEKEARDDAEPSASLAESPCSVLLGTSVVSGLATAVIVATGRATAFSDIVARLAQRAPETEFERGLRRFSYLMVRTVFGLVLFVLTVNLALKHNPLDSLLFAVALAVGLTPEFLPMITTIILGQGAQHMARERVIVKHLAAIENFGSMDILCSDKTGTLTTGAMVLDKCLDPSGVPSERVQQLACVNSAYETGIRSPLDAAILAHGKLDVAAYRKVDEIPFDFERRRLTIVVEREGQRLLITKGAPESVLAQCSAVEPSAPGAPGQVKPLDAASRAVCEQTYRELNAEGYMTLAVAYRVMPEQPAYRAADEVELTLAGFLAFFDPPREDAAAVLDSLRADGIEVKILTGDNALVAQHICTRVGLDGAHIMTGDEVDRLSDPALQQVAERTTVFARVSPAQKNRIMLALKRRGHAVGFLGDGINDAPSLHVADVGISVATAVDVAKDAAEIILLERSLSALHRGVLEGRKSFGNVMKFLLMGTSSNFGNMFSMAGAAVFLPYLPMTAAQILLNNFLYTISQVTIPTDNVDATYMRKPHHWDMALIRDFMFFIGPISSIYDFLTFWLM